MRDSPIVTHGLAVEMSDLSGDRYWVRPLNGGGAFLLPLPRWTWTFRNSLAVGEGRGEGAHQSSAPSQAAPHPPVGTFSPPRRFNARNARCGEKACKATAAEHSNHHQWTDAPQFDHQMQESAWQDCWGAGNLTRAAKPAIAVRDGFHKPVIWPR